eukprot:scaffold16549_cov117-Isochrysis_galbana.AAC.3
MPQYPELARRADHGSSSRVTLVWSCGAPVAAAAGACCSLSLRSRSATSIASPASPGCNVCCRGPGPTGREIRSRRSRTARGRKPSGASRRPTAPRSPVPGPVRQCGRAKRAAGGRAPHPAAPRAAGPPWARLTPGAR